MTDQEATERLAAGFLAQLSDPERAQLFRCKRDLEKVLRKYGALGLLAFGTLAAELSAGRKPGEIKIDEPEEAKSVDAAQ